MGEGKLIPLLHPLGNLALVLFLLVVIDTDEEYFAVVIVESVEIFLGFYLSDGTACGLV